MEGGGYTSGLAHRPWPYAPAMADAASAISAIGISAHRPFLKKSFGKKEICGRLIKPLR